MDREQALLTIRAPEVERRRAISQGRAVPPWKVARVLTLRREGLAYLVIAERLGLHLATCKRIAARAGLVVRQVCSCCGRVVGGPPGGPREKGEGAIPPAATVCTSCKPQWRERMRFQGRVQEPTQP